MGVFFVIGLFIVWFIGSMIWEGIKEVFSGKKTSNNARKDTSTNSTNNYAKNQRMSTNTCDKKNTRYNLPPSK